MAGTRDYDEFVQAQARRMSRTAWLLTGDAHAAEDLVQDTLVKLFVSWKRVSRADDPAQYTRAMMVNSFISGRRRKSSSEVPTDAIVEDTSEGADYVRTDLLRALATLDRTDRTILVLRYFEDMSPDDVAAQVGMTSGAVRTRTSRALVRIRPLLDGYQRAPRPAGQPTTPPVAGYPARGEVGCRSRGATSRTGRRRTV